MKVPPKIAIHLHLHYTDLLSNILEYLRNIPIQHDIYITVTNESEVARVAKKCSFYDGENKVYIRQVENKGRDVKPFYTDLADVLINYDYVCHIHGKKSEFNQGATSGWLEHLLENLMGTTKVVEDIIETFETDPEVGLIYPTTFDKMPFWAHTWLSNYGNALRLKDKFNIKKLPKTYFSYPIGNMFWARVEAIRPLFGAFQDADYPQENKQTDGELMHALERMVAVISSDRGYKNLIARKTDKGVALRNSIEVGIDYSSYDNNSLETLIYIIASPNIKVISFDIFDTLIIRSLLNPDDLFDLMQKDFTSLTGETVSFKSIRTGADSWARQKLQPGKDVTLDDIYVEIQQKLGLSNAVITRLKNLELAYETKVLRPRSSMIEVLNIAFKTGKRVILTSDMYLSKEQVRTFLNQLNISSYHEIYISSEIGLRKDNRKLFPYIIQQEKITPGELLHIGDNEHSDIQIPSDLGAKIFHVLRTKELFTRTSLAKHLGELNDLPLFLRTSIGLAINKRFDKPFPKINSFCGGDLNAFGYFYFGPILLAFTKWVAEMSKKDGIEELYFLSRDGEILYSIYEMFRNNSENPNSFPKAHYLEISRRSIGVASVENRGHLDRILEGHFFENTLRNYMDVRLGIDLLEHPLIDVTAFGFSSINEIVAVPLDLDRLRPLGYHLFDTFKIHFEEERESVGGYLEGQGLFSDSSKAIVDIGYSGSMQRMLNNFTGKALHGYYMVTYNTIAAFINRPNVFSKGLFGDSIDPYAKDLIIDRYSLFFEMVMSSVNGPVRKYVKLAEKKFKPVYEHVSEEEKYKLEKLPIIHEGILNYCNDLLFEMKAGNWIEWEGLQLLEKPFQIFMENPEKEDVEMLAGYSLDDHFCGNGVLYWVPEKENLLTGTYNPAKYLWKKMLPHLAIHSYNDAVVLQHQPKAALNNTATAPAPPATFYSRDTEIYEWYRNEYEILPKWYKKIGHLFKLLKGTKRIRIVVEDVNYPKAFPSKADEIQAWYNKEYEVLPLWYKRFGHLIKVGKGKKKVKQLF